MSRRSDPDERERKRLRLLTVAAGEFARLGFDRANINTISELAGVSKGGVYLYTESKEQLFRMVLEEIGAQTSAALDASLSSSATAPAQERLRTVAGAFLGLARDYPDFMRLQASALFGVNRAFQDATAAILRQVAARLAAAFDDEMRSGALRPVSPDALAVLLLGMLQTFALLPEALGWPQQGASGPADADALLDLLLDLLWRGLAPGAQAGAAPRGG